MIVVSTQKYLYAGNLKKSISNCYGIAYKDDHYYLAVYDKEKSIIKKYNNDFTFTENIKTKHLDNAHQICFVGDQLLVTNTGKDSIYDVQSQQYINLSRGVKISNKTINKGDKFHINSIYYDDERIYILGARGKFYILDAEYNLVNSFFIPYRSHIPPREGLKYRGFYHNIIKVGKWFYSCEKYGLIRFTETHYEELIKTGDFLRGLAYDGKHWILGLSNSLPREYRGDGDSIIAYYDNNFNLVHSVQLENAGQIRDIYLGGSSIEMEKEKKKEFAEIPTPQKKQMKGQPTRRKRFRL